MAEERPYGDRSREEVVVDGGDDDDRGEYEVEGGNDEDVDVNAPGDHFHYNRGGGGRGGVTVASAPRTSELTLAFEGEVYVFPAVTPEKVQAVLFLLGEHEIPTSVPTIDLPFNHSNKGFDDAPYQSTLSRRIASLVRFREKRKEMFSQKN